MEPLRRTIFEDQEGAVPRRRDFLVCTSFAPQLTQRRILVTMHVEMEEYTQEPRPVLDELGQPVYLLNADGTEFLDANGNAIPEYELVWGWYPYCRYHPHGWYPAPAIESNMHKFVDTNFDLVDADTPGAVPEVLAIWGAMMQGIPAPHLIGVFMERMISRGNFNDLRILST